MPATAEFKKVVKGPLLLKGKSVKASKKKRIALNMERQAASASHNTTNGHPDDYDDDDDNEMSSVAAVQHSSSSPKGGIESGLTAAEATFRLVRRRREFERSSKMTELTHRQKMDIFNSHLATLSEHFDIPKVGPG
eukprot:Lankesteria_metandrocarpae@DN24_c0_g1_i1.p1